MSKFFACDFEDKANEGIRPPSSVKKVKKTMSTVSVPDVMLCITSFFMGHPSKARFDLTKKEQHNKYTTCLKSIYVCNKLILESSRQMKEIDSFVPVWLINVYTLHRTTQEYPGKKGMHVTQVIWEQIFFVIAAVFEGTSKLKQILKTFQERKLDDQSFFGEICNSLSDFSRNGKKGEAFEESLKKVRKIYEGNSQHIFDGIYTEKAVERAKEIVEFPTTYNIA